MQQTKKTMQYWKTQKNKVGELKWKTKEKMKSGNQNKQTWKLTTEK